MVMVVSERDGEEGGEAGIPEAMLSGVFERVEGVSDRSWWLGDVAGLSETTGGV